MKNNKIKKIISINLILISILSIFNFNSKSKATITRENETGEITVSNIEPGVNVTLTQLASIEYSFQRDQATDNYVWLQQVEEWIRQNYPEYLDTREFYKKVKDNSEEANNFYQKMVAAIGRREINVNVVKETQQVEGTPSYSENGVDLTGEMTFKNVMMGTYLVTIENGYMIYEPSIVNLIPTYDENENTWKINNQEVIVKASTPSITKSVTEEGKIADDYDTSEEINYILKADVPKYSENSLSKKIYISDKLDPSLTLKKDTITVYGITTDGEEVSLTDYNINYDTTRPNSNENVAFVIEFDYENIKQYKNLKVTYNAKLNRDNSLVIGENGNNNIAYLDYSNNPYSASSIQTKSSNKIPVYTYEIEMKVVDRDNEGLPLDTSTFMVFNPYGRYQRFVKGEEDGVYYVAGVDEIISDFVTKLTVNQEGKLYLKGLKEGTYEIEQIKAKDGYTMSAKSHNITIKDENLDGIREDEYELIIKNAKGYVLPVTGGNGIFLLVGIGASLITIGIALIISINKKRKILKENN